MNINGSIDEAIWYPAVNDTVALKEVTYWSEGLRVKGLLAMPKYVKATEGILYLRGGIQGVGMVRPARIAEIAAEGFVVFAPYYRGNRGGEGKDTFGGDDRYDAVHGVDVLKRYVDRVHLFAFSRGGLMALWTAIMREDITSLVTWGGVSDLVLTYEERVEMRRMMKRVIGGSPMKVPEIYEERTPLTRVNAIHCPVCIIHGSEDANVSIEHAKRLERALIDANQRVVTTYYEGYTHFFPYEKNKEVLKNVCNWMKSQ